MKFLNNRTTSLCHRLSCSLIISTTRITHESCTLNKIVSLQLHTLSSSTARLEEEFDRAGESDKETHSHLIYSFCVVRCSRDSVTEHKKMVR